MWEPRSHESLRQKAICLQDTTCESEVPGPRGDL
jgi:hypothetical protein